MTFMKFMMLNSVCTSRVRGISSSRSPLPAATSSLGAAPTFNPALWVSSNDRRCTFVAMLLFVYYRLAFSLLSCVCTVSLVHGLGPKFCRISRYVMSLYMD